MKVKEAAKLLEVSPGTVYALVASGRLKCYRVGLGRGCIRIVDAQIAEYLGTAAAVAKPSPAPVRRVRLKHLNLD